METKNNEEVVKEPKVTLKDLDNRVKELERKVEIICDKFLLKL